MSLPAAFWDSSALIPLCVLQPQSAGAEVLYERFRVVAWWATEVEMVSGLTRLERMRQISHDRLLVGQRQLKHIVSDWTSIGSASSLVPDACSLLELHPLRAADALQLAAALEACEHKPRSLVFVTADQRLADAARLTGFAVEFL
jgi:uncharacterized protein